MDTDTAVAPIDNPSPDSPSADSPARRTPTPRAQSLNDVRSAIPETCYVRPVGRATRTVIQAALLYLVPVVALALTNTWWALLVLWPLAGLGVAGLFVIGHDASHGALLDSRRANRVLAQLCMGPSAHVEASWDLGHNRIHHGYTTRQGFDFVWHPLTVDEYRQLGFFSRLRHRLEWSCFGSGAYFLREVWWAKMWRFNPSGKRHDAVVRDKLTLGSALAVFAIAAVVLGALTGGIVGAIWVPVKLIVVPFLLFVQIIGWTVYVHHVDPEIRWWPRREWSQFRGQMESTTVVRTPWPINRLWFHNIFVHVPHHVDTRIPFHQLPAAADAIAVAYPDTVKTSRMSVRDYLRATRRCKLYDFDEGRWLTYADART
jgi:omega-6 fatty acid desaturase (delta-12 desaturase)